MLQLAWPGKQKFRSLLITLHLVCTSYVPFERTSSEFEEKERLAEIDGMFEIGSMRVYICTFKFVTVLLEHVTILTSVQL